MRIISKSRRHFEGTHKGAHILITRERRRSVGSEKFYIIVTAADGCHLYDGWSPPGVNTIAEAKREAIRGACLDVKTSDIALSHRLLVGTIEANNAFEKQALRYNMFDADRDSNVKVLFDRFINTRKSHDCVICRESISSGSRVRARAEINRTDHRVMTFYVCAKCSGAMVEAAHGNDRPICERTAIGIAASRAAENPGDAA